MFKRSIFPRNSPRNFVKLGLSAAVRKQKIRSRKEKPKNKGFSCFYSNNNKSTPNTVALQKASVPIRVDRMLETDHARKSTNIKPVCKNLEECKHNAHDSSEYRVNEQKHRVESELLKHHQQLLSSHLSENASRQVIRHKALEIANKLQISRRKFKGTNKWLNDFLKRCENLGYITACSRDNDINYSNHATVRERNVSSTNSSASCSAVICKTLNQEKEQASSNANIPSFNLANLFRVSAKPVLSLNSSQNFPSEETTPEVNHHENTRKAETHYQSRRKFLKKKLLSSRTPYVAFHVGESFPELIRTKNTDYQFKYQPSRSMKSCLRYGSHSYSDDILDQLFTASQVLMDAQEKNKCIKIEIDDDADSGYRSRSEDAEGNCLLSPECKTVTQSETSVTQFDIGSLERNLPSVFEDIPEPVSFSNFSADHEKRVDDEFLPLMTNTSVSDDFTSSIVEDDDWISSLFS